MKGIITIDADPKDGAVIISVDGVKGEDCKEITRNLEKALGTVISSKPTDEMYERPLSNDVHIRR